MNDNVVPLRVRQQPSTAPLEWDGFACPECGGAWFEVAVVVSREGRITGHGMKGRCVDCRGETWLPQKPGLY